MRILLTLFATLFVSLSGLAQSIPNPTYSRNPSDTLRYREISSVQLSIMTPGGEMPVEVDHDSRIAITFGSNDRAEAWYESLQVSSRSPMGDTTPDAAELLHDPFVLEFSANGDVDIVSSPEIPESFSGVSNLRAQFIDFFLVLPNKPLRVGAEWESTIRKEDSTDAGGTVNFEKVGTYRVVGDTLINGSVAMQVQATLQNKIESMQFVPAQGVTVRTVLEGPEQNMFYFSPEIGKLVSRRRSAHLRGATEIVGGPQPMTMDQEMWYESTLNLEQ